MRLLFGLIGALALVGAHASASAFEVQVAPGATDAATSENEKTFQQFYDLLYDRNFGQALALASKLNPDRDNKVGVAIVDGMRAAALLGLKRDSEAKRLIAEAEQLAPAEPFPSTIVLEGSIIAGHYDFAADALDRLINRFPDVAREQNRQLVSFFLRNEPVGQVKRNEDRRIALARLGYGADTASGSYLAADAVDLLVKRGDQSGANELLQYVNEPEPIENMLILKHYSALWPRLQEIAGPQLEKVRAASIGHAEQEYANAPNDNEKLQSYVNALRHAGRMEDAIALRAKLPPTGEAMAEADEQMGWAVNNVAYALYLAGKADEADQLLAQLNDVPRADAGWRVSMIINRLELLVTGGKFDKAASLMNVTEASAKKDGSPFAQQLVRRLRFCILRSLGKKHEADMSLPEMLKHSDDALQPTIDGLLCAGEVDQAEQLALSGLKNSDDSKRSAFEEAFVRSLQPVALTTDDPSVWQERWAELRKRPAVAEAYARLGRDMPVYYLPSKAK